MGIVLCLLALFATAAAGRRSTGLSFGVVLIVGYFYGILRARFVDTYSSFILDSAVMGLYATRIPQILRNPPREVFPKFVLLALWPILMLFAPFQDFLIQLVGLRAAIFFLPCMLLGAVAEDEDLIAMTRFAAVLNIVAFVFALLEYQLGIEQFFPRSQMTQLIYDSRDVAGGSFRIPATFVNAHAYGGAMVAVLPFLVSRWQAPRAAPLEKSVMATAIVTGAIGTFMTGARTPVVFIGIQFVVLALSLKLSVRTKLSLIVFGAIVTWAVLQSDRLQRFTTLSDTEYVSSRIEGSANLGVIETISEHPFGAGLGSAWGTSIPYFLKDYTYEQIGAENEYARIALEQTPIGLLLWIWCILSTLLRRPEPVSPDWAIGMRLSRVYVALCWGGGLLGAGLLTAVPVSALTMFQMGLLNRDRRLPNTRQRQPGGIYDTRLGARRLR